VPDTRRVLDTLIRTGFAGRAAGPGAPLEGPTGGGPSSPEFAGFLEWFGESVAGKDASPPASVETEGLDEDDTLALIRAMVAAAKSDGRIDADERRRIRKQLGDAGLGPEDTALIERELDAETPFEPPAGHRLAPLLYAASLRSVDPGRAPSRRYLESLANRLDLPSDRVAGIHRRFGLPPS
jgi:uncharacterized membrane protein YebE (DUF533 family)